MGRSSPASPVYKPCVCAPHAAHRRLNGVATALAVAHSATGAEELLPLPLTQEGAIPPESLAMLQRHKLAAAEAEDYREAAVLRQLQRSFTPRTAAPALPPCANDADRLSFMREHGYCVIHNCFEGAQLERLCAAWQRVQRPVKTRWMAAKAEGQGVDGHGFLNAAALMEKYGFAPHRLFVDIPVETFFSEALAPEGDDVLLDLIDPPKLTPLLVDYLGASVRLCGVQPRTYSSDRQLDPNADGYTNWHRDGSTPDGFEGPSPAHDIKVFIYFEDVPENGG